MKWLALWALLVGCAAEGDAPTAHRQGGLRLGSGYTSPPERKWWFERNKNTYF